MKFKITFIIIFIDILFSYSQQIESGYAPYLTDWTQPLLSGVYGGPNAVGRVPDSSAEWQHLFVIRHGNPANNHQLQIGSSFSSNDRLFFRKIGAGLTAHNPEWIELATRETNTFNGNQNVNGNIGIGSPSPISPLDIVTNSSAQGIIVRKRNLNDYGNILFYDNVGSIGFGGLGAAPNRIRIMSGGNGDAFEQISITSSGLVGIGTTNPDSKLAVNGTIHSKEVKVDMTGWSDFVFAKDYNLPTLEQVEKHIAEKGHLENIPNEKEVLENGINLGEMNAKLLQKIEELTLYMIEMKKETVLIKNENERLKSENVLMRKNQIELEKRILNIEKK